MSHKSCWWLEDHIEFGFRGSISACCYGYVDPEGQARGNVELCKVDGDRFPAEAIRAGRERIHAAIAADAHDHCSRCPILVLKDWAVNDYLVKLVTINVWSHCNLKCVYCYTAAPGFEYDKVDYSVPAVINDMLEGGYLDPAGTVVWGGGDISALPEFNGVSKQFLDYGVNQVFKTSAFKFLRGVANALAAGKGSIEVSVDAGTRETYAKYKGRDAWDQVVRNIARYREYGAINLKYIADEPNLSDDDINGFRRLVEETRPQQTMVTPEFEKAFANGFKPETVRRMGRLIHTLKETGLYVTPTEGGEGKRLFPNIWPEVEAELVTLAA